MAIPNDNTRAVFAVLKECAKNMYTDNYDNIAQRAGMEPGAGRAMGPHLGHIRDEICVKRGLPHLNQLAVLAGTWRPGDSVLPDKFTIPDEAAEMIWRGMVLQVFAYPWDTVEFDG